MRNPRRFPLAAVAALAALVLTTAACQRPRPPTNSTTTTTRTPTTAAPTTTRPTTTTTAPPAVNVQTRKIRYGPFTVPNVNSPGKSPFASFMPSLGVTLENGMIWNQPVTNVEKPCVNCYLTSIQAGLEYEDGANANIHNGLWLHHMVAMASGTGKVDATCQSSQFSLPHFAVGGNPTNTERFFASGNERTTMDILAMQAGLYGYKVNEGDKFSMLVELMNMNTTDKTVYLTLDYKFVPGDAPGFKPARPVWLDVAQCGTSEVAAKTGKYTINSQPWTSTINGKLLGGGGHLHDGGTNLTITNNGQQFCNSVAAYGTKPEFVEPGDMDHGDHDGGQGHGGTAHLSEMSLCPPGSTIKVGDRLELQAHYDDSVHPHMVHDGKLHNIMGIAILYYGS